MSTPEPHSLPPADLGSVFTRAAGLRGVLAPTRPTQAPPAQEGSATSDPTPSEQAPRKGAAASSTQPKAPTAKRSRRPRGKASIARKSPATPTPSSAQLAAAPSTDEPADQTTPAGPAGPEDLKKGVVVYAALSVRERLTAHRKRTGRTITQVLFDAFDSTYEDLPQLYKAESPQGNSLFDRPASPRRADSHDPIVSIFAMMSKRNKTVIDTITARVAPGNPRARSRVAALALDTYLPPLNDGSETSP